MAKSKRKRTGPPSQPNIVKQVDSICATSMRTGENHGAYERAYQIPDEKPIRQIEAKANPTQLQAFRAWMLADVAAIRKLKDIPSVGRDSFMGDTKQWRDSLIMSAGMLLGYMASPIDPGDFSAQIKRIADIEKDYPDEFYEHDMDKQAKRQIDIHIYDHITRAVYSMSNWELIFPEKREMVWNQNIQTILKAIAVPEKIEMMEKWRDKIIAKIASVAFEIIEFTLRPDDLVFPSALGPRFNSVLATPPSYLTKTDIKLPNIDDIIKMKQQFPLMEPVKPEPKKDNSKLEAFCAAMGSLAPTQLIKFTKALRDIPHVAILYAAFKNFTEKNSLTYPTLMTDCLYLMCFCDRFTNIADRDTLSTYQSDPEKVLRISPTLDRPFTKELKQRRDQVKKDADAQNKEFVDFTTNSTTLWYLAGTETGTILPEDLTIDMAMEDTFKGIGYSDREAAALCGFITAADHCNDSKRMISAFIQWDGDEEPEEPQEQEKDIDIDMIKNKIRSQVQEELTKLKSQVTEELDNERRKHIKEQRKAYHAASEAEEQARVLAEENEKLKDRVNELERLVSQLEDQIPLPNENDENDVETYETTWPSDFGVNESILCIGGSDNWIKRQQERFPNIRFYGPQTIPDDSAVFHADLIFINTFVLKHKTFYPVQNAAKRAGVPLKNFPAAGINTSTDFILKTCQEMFSQESRQ